MSISSLDTSRLSSPISTLFPNKIVTGVLLHLSFISGSHLPKLSNDFLLVTSKTKIIPSTFFMIWNAAERNLSCPAVSHKIIFTSFPLFKRCFFSILFAPIVVSNSPKSYPKIELHIEVLPTCESPNNPNFIELRGILISFLLFVGFLVSP